MHTAGNSLVSAGRKCQHAHVTTIPGPAPRDAALGDIDQLLPMWGLVFDEAADAGSTWRDHAQTWFANLVDDRRTAYFPVVDVDNKLVASAIGTLELGVPNPQCPLGRAVRLANVITLPTHRGHGYGTALVESVIGWARSLGADRVDLSATPEGRRIYERSGFRMTSAPRMKFVL